MYSITRPLDTVTHLCRAPDDEWRPAAAIPPHAVLPYVGACADRPVPACLHRQLCIGPGDETVVSGGYDQAVRVWDMRSRSFDPIQTLKPFSDSVTAVLVTKRCGGPFSGLWGMPSSVTPFNSCKAAVRPLNIRAKHRGDVHAVAFKEREQARA